MKNILVTVSLIACLCACSASKKVQYETVSDNETKVLKGYISRSVLEKDSAFSWFEKNVRYGKADTSAVKAFRENAGKFTMLVFGGTWCHDSQALLPVFYRLVDASGYPDKKIKLVALDRAKTGTDDLCKQYNVTNVPTFIVLHDGKEIGRVVEYGKDGQIDKELGEIVKGKVAE